MNVQNSRGFNPTLNTICRLSRETPSHQTVSRETGDDSVETDSFELFSTTGGAAVGGEEEANTLDGGSGRPSKVTNDILLSTFCPKGAPVARIYEPFSLQGNVNFPFIICAPTLFKTIS